MMKKVLGLSLVILVLFSFCSCTFQVTSNGIDSKNSTLVKEIVFVEEYLENYKNEKAVTSYSDANQLSARVYFKNVPSVADTDIKFVWETASGEFIYDAELSINPKTNPDSVKIPVTCYLYLEDATFPADTYVLRVYLADLNVEIGKAEIVVK